MPKVSSIPDRNGSVVYVFDTAVDGYQKLLAGIDRPAEVILMDGMYDGLRQLADGLAGKTGIEELHIICHGRDGALVLGHTVLSQETLCSHADELMAINRALSCSADILLYGCEVAKTATGEAFVAALAEATGANIAASRTLTGAVDLGGDWELDVHVGVISASIGFSRSTQRAYPGTLPTTIDYSGYSTSNNKADWLDGSDGVTDVSGLNLTLDFGDGTEGSNTFTNLNMRGAANTAVGSVLGGTVGATDGTFFNNNSNGFQLSGDINFSFEGFTVLARADSSGDTFTIRGFDNSGTQIVSDTIGWASGAPNTTASYTIGSGDWDNVAAWGSVRKIVVDYTNDPDFQEFAVIDMTVDAASAPANTAPELGGTPADDTATEDVATAIDLSAYNVSDADGDTITLTLAVDRGSIASTDGNGTTAGVTVANSGTGSMTLQGSAVDLNTYLNDTSKITFTTASNDTTTAVLTVTPNDGTADGTADTVNITINAVNDDPSVAGLASDLTFAEDTQGNVDLSAAAFSDVDSGNVTVTITASEGTFATPADGAGVGGGVTETLVNATTITLVGAAADISTYLDTASNIQWTGATNDTGNDTSTFTITANDGDGSGDVALGTINADITPQNDEPVFTGLDGTPAFTEGGSAEVLDSNVTVADVELDALNSGNGDYSGATLTIARNGGANASDVFAVPTGGNLTVAGGPDGGGTISAGGNVIATIANTGNGQIQLSFADNGTTPTTALVNEVMQAITYQNTGNDQTSNPQLDWTFSDGAANGTGSVTVTLTDVNDAPSLTATGGNPTFAEDGGAQDLYNTVSADTVETGQTFTALTLTVTNVSDGASEILSFDGSDIALTNGNSVTTATNSLSVSVSVSGSTATVSFSGATLSEAQLQTLVDGLTYRNTSDDPTTSGNRVVTITSITDSGGTAGGGVESATPNLTSTVTVSAVNDQPTLSSLGPDAGNVAYTSGSTTFVAFDSGVDANLQDAELDALDSGAGNYNGATITLVRNGGADATDRFGIAGGTTALDNGSTVTVGGTNIGQVTAGSAASGTVTITLNGSATSALVDTFFQSIGYTNTNGAATGTVTIDVTFNDGNGGSQGTGGAQSVTQQVGVAIGNTPVLDLDGNDSSGTGSGGFAAAFTESTPVAIADSDVAVSDADGGATIAAITITLTNDQNGADEGLSVSAAAQNALTGIAGAADITRQDTISVTGATASLGEVQTFLQNVFYDNTSDDPDATARTITVTLTDNDGLTSTSVTSTVSVTGVNDEPVLTATGDNPAFTEDGAAADLFSSVTAGTVESGQALTGLTLTVTNVADGASEILTIDGSDVALTNGNSLTTATNSLNVTVAVTAGTATVSFTGASLSEAALQTLVDGITYRNTSDTPTTAGNRVVTLTGLTDDGGTANGGDATAALTITSTVSVAAANDAPVFGNLGGDTPSGAPSALIAFDAGGNATVTDPDSTDLDGGTLTITRTGALEGSFALNDAQATSGGDGTIAAGQTIAVGATSIGTVTTDGQGANNLAITLNANATPSNVQALIQALNYSSAETGSHGFTVTLSDGDGGTSSAATVTLSVANPSTGGGGGGSTGPVTVVTEDNDDGSGPPTTTTTVTTGSGGSGSAAIVENTNNNGNVVTATLPANTSISSTGPKTAQTPTQAVNTLVAAVDARNASSETELIGGAQAYLNTLAETTTLDVRTIVPTTTQSSLSEPIVITGTSPEDGSTQSEAFVIDLRSLPSGTVIQLENIEFATIIGEATINGGSGQNYVMGDDSAQIIVLGEGDDQLFGGAGDDTVGSTTGNDQIFGEAGDDLLFGGAGNDLLNGGANRDAALYGATSDGVILSGTRGTVTAVDAGGTDTLTGVELVVFTGENTTGKDRVTVLLQDNAPVAGQYGFNESAYLSAHQDVAAAVAVGIFASGAEHYALFGEGEGRVVDLLFDAQFYLADNPDVAAAVTEGIFASASEHYQLHGYAENRSLNPLFDGEYYLTQNEDVANAVGSGGLDSAYHHFVLYGDQEGRAASRFFDTAAYREEQGLGSDHSALEHFLLVGLPQGVSAPTTADFTSEGLA
ncbi:MAG: DUF4347 domain-containing protein [Labrenzia sp.]